MCGFVNEYILKIKEKLCTLTLCVSGLEWSRPILMHEIYALREDVYVYSPPKLVFTKT